MSAIEDTQDRSPEANDDELGEFMRLKKDIRKAEIHRSKWRTEAMECYDVVAGHQWKEEDQKLLDEQHRPTVTFNRTEPLVKAVRGLEVNNRQSVIYLPRQTQDATINELFTNAGKWVRDECNAEDEESEAFTDVLTCGEGWTETRMDYEDEPTGKIIEERIDPLEMGVNKGAFRANYVDARMIYRVREMDPEDIRALLALPDDLSDEAMDASSWLNSRDTTADGGKGNKKDYPDKTRPGVKDSAQRDTVKVIQCQYWKREKLHMVGTENDEQPMELSEADYLKFSERATTLNMQVEHTEITRKIYYQCFLGIRILHVEKMQMQCFQFQAMTGERDRKLRCFYGMVRGMRDPQQWSNKFLSQTMHHINVNAKGGLLAETDAFVNVRQAEKDWADPTKIVWVKPGSLQKQKIKERTAIPLPPGLDQLMLFAISSIRDVTGINLELLGQADREQAASLEQQRRQSAMTILATMFDSLRKYRKNNGRLTLKFIALLPEGTLIRVSEEGQIKYIPLIKQGVDFAKFDTIIDQSPTSPDQKQFVWAITAQILQMNILPPQAVIELLKYSPYPESVVAEIRKALGMDGTPPPEQLQEQLKQAEGALQVMEQKLTEAMQNAKTAEDDRAIEMLQLEVDEYKAETERLKAQWDSRIKAAGAIATGAKVDAQNAQVVTSGEQQLPDIGGGGATSALEQKVDQMAEMLAQLMQAIAPQQAEPQAPPPAEIPQEPPVEGL